MSRKSVQPTTASVFVRNLTTLGFEPPMGSTWVVNEQTFTVNPNSIRAFEYISHFLFQLLDKNKAETTFVGVWPIHNIKQSQEYRRRAFQWLKDIQPGTVLMYVPLRKSYFTNCQGEQFNEIVSAFTTVVLETKKSRNTQDKHEMDASKALDPEPSAAGKRSTIHRPSSAEVFDRKKTRTNDPDDVTVSLPRIPLNHSTMLPSSVTEQSFVSSSFSFTSSTQLPTCKSSSIPSTSVNTVSSTVHNPTATILSSFLFSKATLISQRSPSPSISYTYSSPCKETSFITSPSHEAVSFSTFIKERKEKDRIMNEENARKDLERFEKEILERNRLLQEQGVKEIDLEDPFTVIDDKVPVVMDETKLREKEDIVNNFKKLQKEFIEKAKLAAKKAEDEAVKKAENEVEKKNEAETGNKAENEVEKKNEADTGNKAVDEEAKKAAETIKKAEEETEAAKNVEADKAKKINRLLDPKEIEEITLNTKSIQELVKLVKEKKREDEVKAEKLKEFILKENEKKKMTEEARSEVMKLKQEEADKKRMASAAKFEREREEKSIAEAALKAQKILETLERLERDIEIKLESQRIRRELEAEELKKSEADLKAAQVKYDEIRCEEDSCRVSRLKLVKEREIIQVELNEAEKELSALEKKSDNYLQKTDVPIVKDGDEEKQCEPHGDYAVHALQKDNEIYDQGPQTSVNSVVGIVDSPDSIKSIKLFDDEDSFAVEEKYGLYLNDSADFSVPATVNSLGPMEHEKNSEWMVCSKDELPTATELPNPFLETSSPNQQSETQKRLLKLQNKSTTRPTPCPPQRRQLFSKKRLAYFALLRTPVKRFPRSHLQRSLTSMPVVERPVRDSVFERDFGLDDSPPFPNFPIRRHSPTRPSNQYTQRDDYEYKFDSVDNRQDTASNCNAEYDYSDSFSTKNQTPKH